MPPVSSKAADLCPYQQIIDLYHEALPDNPRCKVVSKARQAAIKARWTEAAKLTCKPFGYATRAEGLAAWQQFFDICAESAYLTGQVPGTNGRPPYMADIDFLMSPSGFAVLVLQDLLGLNSDFKPKFVKSYLMGEQLVHEAISQYHDEVISEVFPELKNCFMLKVAS